MSEVIEIPRQRRARRAVMISYGVIVVVGAVFFALSFQYDFYRYEDQVGPGFLPRVVGAIVLLLGVALIVQEVRVGSVLEGDSGSDEHAGGEEGEQTSAMSVKSLVKLLTVFGLIIVAALLVPVLGLVPPLVLLVVALTIFVERMPIVPSLCISVGAAVIAYVLFVLVLQVPVPMGVFEGVI